MTAKPLRDCPTCHRGLDDSTRAAMGLRTGEFLNGLCPGWIGPSDIDHVLHAGEGAVNRVAFFEYKRQRDLTQGQEIFARAITGSWHDADGRSLTIRYEVFQEHDPAPLDRLRVITAWLWPNYRRGLDVDRVGR